MPKVERIHGVKPDAMSTLLQELTMQPPSHIYEYYCKCGAKVRYHDRQVPESIKRCFHCILTRFQIYEKQGIRFG